MSLFIQNQTTRGATVESNQEQIQVGTANSGVMHVLIKRPEDGQVLSISALAKNEGLGGRRAILASVAVS